MAQGAREHRRLPSPTAADFLRRHDAGQTVRRPSLATVTLDDVDGAWLIDTFHNTVTGGPGYMFGNTPSLPDKK